MSDLTSLLDFVVIDQRRGPNSSCLNVCANLPSLDFDDCALTMVERDLARLAEEMPGRWLTYQSPRGYRAWWGEDAAPCFTETLRTVARSCAAADRRHLRLCARYEKWLWRANSSDRYQLISDAGRPARADWLAETFRAVD